MSDMLHPGMTLPDFELPDENGELHRLSELQGDDPMILLLGRGEHCPRERQHHGVWNAGGVMGVGVFVDPERALDL